MRPFLLSAPRAKPSPTFPPISWNLFDGEAMPSFSFTARSASPARSRIMAMTSPARARMPLSRPPMMSRPISTDFAGICFSASVNRCPSDFTPAITLSMPADTAFLMPLHALAVRFLSTSQATFSAALRSVAEFFTSAMTIRSAPRTMSLTPAHALPQSPRIRPEITRNRPRMISSAPEMILPTTFIRERTIAMMSLPHLSQT